MTTDFVTSLDHLVLTVADVDATCDFYVATLGLERVTFGDGRSALRFGDQKLNLQAAAQPQHPVPTRAAPGTADFCFRTEQPVGLVLRRLRAAGVPLVEGPVQRTGATGAIVSVYLLDPDGNLVEVGTRADRIGALDVHIAEPCDRLPVEVMLADTDLPLDGLDDAWPHMLVARDRGRTVAAAGLEMYGNAGLLRSVVVDAKLRAQGIGEELVWRALALGRAHGIDSAWLLTFVPDWFQRLDFQRVARAAAPEALQASAEFRGACPETAVLMWRRLTDNGGRGPRAGAGGGRF
jgi:catechol 2,3-dioxygenase-like lactoylglutathione lyase family enzyme/N-acetylglutamate synthase-like GNAT family acetyltransferase